MKKVQNAGVVERKKEGFDLKKKDSEERKNFGRKRMSLTKKKPLILKEGVRWKQKILFFNGSSLLFARLVHKSSCHFIGNSINTV